jgi:biopolymer transport protein ExbB/TolQ
MTDLLDSLSSISTTVIAAAAAVHLAFFVLLWFWFRRDSRMIADSLDRFTRGLKHRSVLEGSNNLGDQIEAFLADVNEVLALPPASDERRILRDRVNILDERRGYLNALPFETGYNVARTMIEAYPLAGVLGTILAIGAALASDNAGSESEIESRFGDAIWSTFAGLIAAIVLMFLNSLIEPKFNRLAENRAHVRETVARAKRELSLTPATDAVATGAAR